MSEKNTQKAKIVRPDQIIFKEPDRFNTMYKEEYDDKLYRHLSKGLSFKSFDVGVSEVTLGNWLKRHPSFALARERGEKKRLQLLEAAGIKMVIEGNAAAWKVMMQDYYGVEKSPTHDALMGDDEDDKLLNVTPERQKRLERIRELAKRLKLK